MAQDPRRRAPARRNGHSNEPIQLETGDFESLDSREYGDDDAPVLPPTKVLPNDPQRAVPTHVYDPDSLDDGGQAYDPPLPPDSFNPPIPSDTHPIPEVRSDPPAPSSRRSRPGPPVGRAALLEPAFLYVERGPGEGRNVPIPDGEMVIGRSSGSGLKLSHPSVSREHAVLERQGARFFVHDAGSHNGTYVNGRQISGRVELSGGDEIAMGKAVVILRYGNESERRHTSTATRAPLTERKGFKFTVFGSAVALGILSVLILSRLKPSPDEEPRVAAATPLKPAPIARAEPSRPEPPRAEPKVAPEPEPAEPRPAPEPEVDRPEPVKPAGKGDLSLTQPSEVSAAKVFQDTKNQQSAGARDYVLDANKPLKAPAKRNSRVASYSPKAPMSSPDTADAGEAMAMYEAGDLDGAVGAARAAGNNSLANKISTFKKEITAGKAALGAKDGAGAIKHYTAALAIDDELSKGWGTLGNQIRAELAKLFEKAGEQTAANGDSAKAAQLFQRALKYNPSSERAKQGLANLKSGAAAGKPDDARSAADQAFDQ